MITVPLFAFFGKDLELELNSTKVYALYLVGVGAMSSVLTSVVVFFMYVMTYEDHFFVNHSFGLMGTVVAVLVRLIKLNRLNENALVVKSFLLPFVLFYAALPYFLRRTPQVSESINVLLL